MTFGIDSVAGSLLIMVTLSVLALTVSSFTQSGRTAGLALVMLFVFSEALRGILSLFNRDLSSLLSPVSNLQQGLDFVFGQPYAYRIHPLISLMSLGAMLGVCLLVLYRRMRPVEVVT